MVIQYGYALVTMLPCPLWFWYRWASATFLLAVFTWATYNGATFYIDVFGKRMEKEVEAMRREVAKWQNTPEGRTLLDATPAVEKSEDHASATSPVQDKSDHLRSQSVDEIPLLDQKQGSTATANRDDNTEGVRQR